MFTLAIRSAKLMHCPHIPMFAKTTPGRGITELHSVIDGRLDKLWEQFQRQ